MADTDNWSDPMFSVTHFLQVLWLLTMAARMVVAVVRFEPYNEEDIKQYFGRLEMFLLVNALADSIKAIAYLVLQNLLYLQTWKTVKYQP